MILRNLRAIVINGLLSVSLACATMFAPLAVSADDATTCTPPSSSTPGVHVPTGADAGTYHYDCTYNVWLNDHYMYDPSTGLTTPLDPVVYTCNPQTNLFDTQIWVYNSPKGIYVLEAESVSTPPAGATVVPCESASISNTGPGSTNTTDLGGSINNTGPNSSNSFSDSGTNNSTLNNTNGSSVNNTITAGATSGNSLVLANNTAGSANSGNTTDIANVVNMLQSATSGFGEGNTTTFTANINGDVNGDFLLDPAALTTVQPTAPSPNLDNNLTINQSANASINNNINVGSTSGDATVDSNTTAGNATTGNAEAVANVVNMIDSALSAGHSFIGTININGNLNGDILLPPNFVDQLIAANVPTATISVTGPSSTNTINEHPQGSTTNVTNTNNEGITNNVDATAATGTATVDSNTNAGNATTGTATTHLTAFNLTGSQVIGKNALLVFVNVMGSWVGLIVNAPAGADVAALGGGLTINQAGDNTTNIDSTNNATITNNIGVDARSGDATVRRNTNAGNATSGNADAAVNLLNVENSGLSLGGWFGILFINVFGTWHGSFGINTSAGDPIAASNTGSVTSGSVADASQLVKFAPHFASTSGGLGGGFTGDQQIPPTVAAVLASQIKHTATTAPTPDLASPHHSNFLPILAVVLFVTWIGLDQLISKKLIKL